MNIIYLKMTITIDELCERLGINQVISEEEYPEHKKAAAPYDLQGKWFDCKALPSTKAVAPIVCEKLRGVESGAFFCTPPYGPPHLMMEQEDFMDSIFQEAGLPRLETVAFNFIKVDGTLYSGRMLFERS